MRSVFSVIKRKLHSISQEDNHHTWSVLRYLYQKQLSAANKRYACFLLNISDQSHEQFERHKHIWDGADFRVAVDGSANYLAKRRLLHTADVISGDFDSIDAKLIERLQSPRRVLKQAAGTVKKDSEPAINEPVKMPQVVETPCQKETDFTKAIRVVQGLKPDIQFFFGIYHSDGSRIDHIFGLVNTLHIIKKSIFLVNTQSNTISWLLQEGNHTILKPRGQEPCSLVPFTGPTDVKTHGLQYNLHSSTPLSFGGLVSTSNFCYDQKEKIVIETNREILWSIDIYTDKKSNK